MNEMAVQVSWDC